MSQIRTAKVTRVKTTQTTQQIALECSSLNFLKIIISPIDFKLLLPPGCIAQVSAGNKALYSIAGGVGRQAMRKLESRIISTYRGILTLSLFCGTAFRPKSFSI